MREDIVRALEKAAGERLVYPERVIRLLALPATPQTLYDLRMEIVEDVRITRTVQAQLLPFPWKQISRFLIKLSRTKSLRSQVAEGRNQATWNSYHPAIKAMAEGGATVEQVLLTYPERIMYFPQQEKRRKVIEEKVDKWLG